jgi:regulation of enolase protein 1 (concanavalin A-like superfamily)
VRSSDAYISSWGAGSITATVPSGATTGNVVVTAAGGVASAGSNFTVVQAPSITSLSPTVGAVGAEVAIAGANFGATQGTGSVTFNGTAAAPTSWSASTIAVPVPSGATTGNVIVNAIGGSSNAVAFTLASAPNITSLSVTSGVVGTSVTITGTNFGSTEGTGTVSFNGTDATPTSWSAMSIVTTVPTGATTGNVVVSASGVPSNGIGFTVVETLGISSMLPGSGVVGEVVTLTGAGFGANQGTSTLKLNGTTATVASWTDTVIVASVPSGASTGPFTVTVNGNAANSASFTVTTLPSGWSDGDIGSVGVAGSASYASGTFTIAGAGLGTFSTPDGFHFVYQPLSGDGTIVARVVSVTGGYAPQAGVMIRETLDPSATNAFTFYYQNFIWLSERTTSGGSPGYEGGMNVTPPYWVKLVRSGTTFTGYGSADGINWTQVGTSHTISMASSVYIGLGVTSRTMSALTTATFDGVSVSQTSAPAPVITSLSGTTGSIGSQVTISGTGFGATQSGSLVTLNGSPVTINSWSSTAIVVTIPTGATSGNFLVSVAPAMNASNAMYFTVTSQPLPASWLDADVGAVGMTGSATYANGTFTVAGAGLGTFSTPDGFHFVYQPLSGDGTIVARVVSVTGGYAPQAGVMIRETLDPSATNAFTFYYQGSIPLTERTTTGGSSGNQGGPSVSLPYWIMLVRSGTSFSGYASYNGLTWTQVGTTQTISMAQTVYVGMAVTSRSTSSLTTATFDNVSLSPVSAPAPVITTVSATTGAVGSQVLITGSGFGPTQNGSLVMLNDIPVTISSWDASSILIAIPAGATSGYMAVSVTPGMNNSNPVYFTVTSQPLATSWLDEDVGAVGMTGSATYASGTFTIAGAGLGMFSTPDGFHFVYQPLSGDGTIVARVVSVTGGYAPQAGVMIRETLDPSAKNAFTFYYQNAITFSERTTNGASPGYQSGPGASPPYWVMLVRSGSSFSGYASYNGLTWTQVGTTQTISMAQTVYVGLAVTSRSMSSLTTAAFDNVSFSPSSAPAPVITSVSATTGTVGSQVQINGSGFGAPQGASVVTLNNAAVTINSWTNTTIVMTVPSGATSGYLVVSAAPSMNDSNPVYFAVTSQPLPAPWLDQDVGPVGVAGSATYANGTFSVKASGTQIYGTSDQMHFVYQPMSGDGTIVARVVSATGSTYPQAGVMIRETLDPASTNALSQCWSGSVSFWDRPTTGGSTTTQGGSAVSPPYWVKMIRTSGVFYGYSSADGVTWTQMGTGQTITMAQNAYVGLAVSSYSNSTLATATFDNVSVTLGSTPVVTSVSPDLGGVSSSVTVTGSSFGATQGTSTVSFNNTAATSITSWTNSQIVALVPTTAPPGTGPVVVTVGSNSSPATIDFTVINPTISALTPPGAQVGAWTTLTGVGFGVSQGTSQVKFNGVAASVSSWSDTSITAQVPSTATSGPVTATVDGVTTAGVSFTVLEALSITGVSQSAGPVGTTITVTGTGFGASQSSSTLSFYGASATVTSWSDTQITATVPAFSSSVCVRGTHLAHDKQA